MRLLATIAALLLLFSCADKTPKVDKPKSWTEEEKRKYFADNFAGLYGFGRDMEGDSAKTFAYFFKKQYPDIKTKYNYDAFPYAFEEEYVDTTKIDSTKHWFRIMVNPCFRRPYCFTVDKKYDKSLLTTKITNGDGGYVTGVLVSTMKFSFSDTLYNNIARRLNSLNFWTLGRDTACHGGLDGEWWTFEAIDNGKYNLIRRWVPQWCGDSVTRQLSKIGINLGKLSRLDNVLAVIGAPKSGM